MSATEEKERIYRKTTHGILYNFGGKNLGFILSFIFTIIIARELGPSDYGSYSFYRNTAAFLALFTILGLDQTMIHFIPALKQRGDGGMLTGLMGKSIEQMMKGTAIMILLSVLVFSIVPNSFGWEYAFQWEIMLLFVGVLVVITLSGLFKGVMAGLFRQRELNIVETVSIISKLLLTIFLFSIGWGLEGVLLAVIISYSFPSVIYYWRSKKEFHKLGSGDGISGRNLAGGEKEANERSGKNLVGGEGEANDGERNNDLDQTWVNMKRYALTMLIFTASYVMLDNQVDIIMLKYLSGNSEAGHYNIAFRFAFISSMVFVGAIDGVLVPAFTSLGSKGSRDQRATLRTSLRYTLFFLVPLSVAGMLFSDQLILVFFGEDYEHSVNMLRLFYGTLVLSIALSWPMRFLMVSIGMERRILTLYVAYGLINVVGNLILIPRYDGFGAVIATGVTSWMITLHLLYEVKRQGVLEFPGWFTVKTVVASIVAGIPFLLLLFYFDPNIDGIGMLAVVYITFSVIYIVASMLLRGITVDEMRSLLSIVTGGADGDGDND